METPLPNVYKDVLFLSVHPPCRLASLSTKMETMDYEEDEDDVAAGEALTVPLADAFSGLQGASAAL